MTDLGSGSVVHRGLLMSEGRHLAVGWLLLLASMACALSGWHGLGWAAWGLGAGWLCSPRRRTKP
jgi:hypothetical protein